MTSKSKCLFISIAVYKRLGGKVSILPSKHFPHFHIAIITRGKIIDFCGDIGRDPIWLDGLWYKGYIRMRMWETVKANRAKRNQEQQAVECEEYYL